MICRAVSESVAIWRSSRCCRVVRATWMATSSARSMMLFSSTPVASMSMAVFVGLCMTDAPSLGLGSIFEPSVYTQASGSHIGVHGVVVGGVCELCGVGGLEVVGSGPRSTWWQSLSICADERTHGGM